MDGVLASCQPDDGEPDEAHQDGNQCDQCTVSEEACGAGGVGGGDDATCLQADEAEGDTGHEQLNDLPEGGGGEAFFRFECRHVLGAGELDGTDNHGNNAGGVHAFSSEVGAEGDHEGHGVAGDHVVGALANVAAEPAEDVTNNDREDRTEHEVFGNGERLDVVAAGHGVDCGVEEDDCDSVVEATFGLQGADEAAGNADGLSDCFHGDGVGRGDGGTDGKGDGDGHAGDPPHGCAGNCQGGDGGEKDRVEQYGSPAAAQGTPGEFNTDGPQQRRKEDRQDDVAVDGNVRSVGDEERGGAEQGHHDRPGEVESVTDADHEHGRNQDDDNNGEVKHWSGVVPFVRPGLVGYVFLLYRSGAYHFRDMGVLRRLFWCCLPLSLMPCVEYSVFP